MVVEVVTVALKSGKSASDDLILNRKSAEVCGVRHMCV